MVCSWKSFIMYEGIVVSTIFKTCDIPDTNVMLCPSGEDIALVAPTNYSSKVWIIHVQAFEWPQCNCPLVAQGIICKYVMKIFKMLHPHIPDGAIVWKIGTFHGVHRGPTLDVHINFVDMPNQEVDVNDKLDDVDALETIKQEEA